jgi:hypothetical protein
VLTGDAAAPTVKIFDSVIDRCIAIQPDNSFVTGGTAIVLHAGHCGELPDHAQPRGASAVIRNCFVDGAFIVDGEPIPDLTKEIQALSVSWCHGAIVEGNQIHNVRHGGPCQPQASVPEAIVRNNSYRNVLKGPWFNLGGLLPTTGIAITDIGRLSDPGHPDTGQVTTSADHLFSVGTRVKLTGTAFDGVVRITEIPSIPSSNPPEPEPRKFRFDTTLSGSGSSGAVQAVIGVEKLLVEGNLIELATTVSDPAPIGIHLDDAAAAFDPHEDVIIRRNCFRYVEGEIGPFNGYAIDVKGAQNVIITNNTVETIPAAGAAIRTEDGPGVNVNNFDNRTPAGPLVDWAMDGYFSEFDVPSEETLMMALFEK